MPHDVLAPAEQRRADDHQRHDRERQRHPQPVAPPREPPARARRAATLSMSGGPDRRSSDVSRSARAAAPRRPATDAAARPRPEWECRRARSRRLRAPRLAAGGRPSVRALAPVVRRPMDRPAMALPALGSSGGASAAWAGGSRAKLGAERGHGLVGWRSGVLAAAAAAPWPAAPRARRSGSARNAPNGRSLRSRRRRSGRTLRSSDRQSASAFGRSCRAIRGGPALAATVAAVR